LEQYVPALRIIVFHSHFFLAATLNLAANQVIEYKYIRKFYGKVTWESDPNRRYATPPEGKASINDIWR
jgi:hypothetical protein